MTRRRKRVHLPNSIRESLLRLKQLDENHPLVAAYGKFIKETPSLDNAQAVFFRFRPEVDDSFEDALVEFLATLEDAIEDANEAKVVLETAKETTLADA